MANENKYIILWEYDSPLILDDLLNYEAGIWFWTLTPGDVVVTDDSGNTGYYSYKNSTLYNVGSLSVDGVSYAETTSLADCRSNNKSFFYDPSTTYLYIHFDGFEPPLDKIVSVGTASGFSWGSFGPQSVYYNDDYYEPRIKQVFDIKQSKDPLYYGLLKFTSGKVKAINNDGYYDNWKARNLYAQASRLLIGVEGDEYADFERFFTGFIGDDDTTWTDFSVSLKDVRAALTNPIASNLLNQTDYPNLNENNIDKPKPVVYGPAYNAECICLNEDETAATYTFLLCDTEFNSVATLTEVLVEGVDQTANAVLNGSAGTFTLSTTYYDPGDTVTATFTVNINNGVSQIIDIIKNYDDKNYLDSFWDRTETTASELLARDTSVYVDDDTKVIEVIEKICSDIDGYFMPKMDGRYTVKIYYDDREPVRTIYSDEWIDEPSVQNNASQYLTTATIKYKHNIADDTYLQYTNTDYQAAAKALHNEQDQTKTFETNLTTLSDAKLKSQTILDFSSNVPKIITRSTKFQNFDLELMDFIIASPFTRYGAVEDWGIYEVIGITKGTRIFEIKLTLKYVRDYTPPTDGIFSVRVTSDGSYRITSNGSTRITEE